MVCFQFWVIMDRVTLNIPVLFVDICFHLFRVYIYQHNCCHNFKTKSKSFPKFLFLYSSSPSNVWESQWLYILARIWHCQSFWFYPSQRVSNSPSLSSLSFSATIPWLISVHSVSVQKQFINCFSTIVQSFQVCLC